MFLSSRSLQCFSLMMIFKLYLLDQFPSSSEQSPGGSHHQGQRLSYLRYPPLSLTQIGIKWHFPGPTYSHICFLAQQGNQFMCLLLSPLKSWHPSWLSVFQIATCVYRHLISSQEGISGVDRVNYKQSF